MSKEEEGLFPQCDALTQLSAEEKPDPREDLEELPVIWNMKKKILSTLSRDLEVVKTII